MLWMRALVTAGCNYAEDDKEAATAGPTSLFELSANELDSGRAVPLSEFEGCVTLVVNIASK